MKIVEKDGKKEYYFEDGDIHIRRGFDEAVAEFDAGDWVEIVLRASQLQKARKAEAWRFVREMIRGIDPDFNSEIGYDWVNGRFYPVVSRGEKLPID